MRLILAIFFFMAIPTTGLGVDRPKVQVSFEVAANHPYGSAYFAPADLQFVHDAAATVMTRELSRHVAFVEFATPAPHRLQVVLDNQEPGARGGGTHTVGFWLRLQSAGLPDSDPLFWVFRNPGSYTLQLGDKQTFSAELELSLKRLIERNHHEVVEKLLSRIAIADRAFKVPNRVFFVLPFSGSELNLGDESQFLIVAEIQDPIANLSSRYTAVARGHTRPDSPELPPEYKAKLLAQAIAPAGDVLTLEGNAVVQAKAVYVLKVVRGSALTPTPPEAFRPGGGQ